MKNLYLRGVVFNQGAGNAVPDGINLGVVLTRMIVLMDTQPNGTLAAVTDILENVNALSQLNLDNRDRFRVLIDKQWCFDPLVASYVEGKSVINASNQSACFKKFKKLNMETIFNEGDTTTVSSINSGALLMLLISTGGTATPNRTAITLTTRIRFQDP